MGTIREIKIDVELGPGGIREETLLDRTETEQGCCKKHDDNCNCLLSFPESTLPPEVSQKCKDFLARALDVHDKGLYSLTSTRIVLNT